jgi:hypothetical protein
MLMIAAAPAVTKVIGITNALIVSNPPLHGNRACHPSQRVATAAILAIGARLRDAFGRLCPRGR